MASSKFELLRSASETVESSEKVLAIAFQNRKKFLSKEETKPVAEAAAEDETKPEEKRSVADAIVSQSKAVWWDMLIRDLSDTMHKKSREIVNIYEDADGSLKNETAFYSGNIKQEDEPQASALDNFYSRLAEIDNYHARYDTTEAMAPIDNLQSEPLFAQRMEHVLDQADKIFSGEEGHGKYLDLHKNYFAFCCLSKLRKLGLVKSDDYLSWLQNFDKFNLVPLYIKQTGQYAEYVHSLMDYLKDFLRRSKPLLNFQEVATQTDEMFESEWEQRSLFGWESAICLIYGEVQAEKVQIDEALESQQEKKAEEHHCAVCRKSFSNKNVFDFHLKGKRHVKAASQLAAAGQSEADLTPSTKFVAPIKQFSQSQILRLRSVARSETWVLRLRAILTEIFEQTQNQVRKKQSSSYTEIEAEKDTMNAKQLLANQVTADDSDDDDDRVKYNPKNLPMGWDGKPIPYWLFKLHGLGKEFKCEICGGASYWGRRAFEKHFQEWRHAYKMKCLGIPNTIHFKDVTEIEHALKLHKKILTENFESTFKPDFQEEFEDQEGNLYSRKQFIDMKRQGLI